MFNPLSVDVAEINRRERLDGAKSRLMFKRDTVSDPTERGKYIQAFHRQLLEKRSQLEDRARRREAAADRGRP